MASGSPATRCSAAWRRCGRAMACTAMWADAEGGPKIVHGFLPRDAKGYRIVETWDTLGMRATRSDDVILEGAFVPDKYIARILPAGGADLFVLAVFAWALLGFGNIYYGMSQRAMRTRRAERSRARSRSPSAARWPTIPRSSTRSPQMALALDPVGPHLEQVARGLVDRRRPWRRLAVEDRLGQVPCGRGVLEDRRPRHGAVRRRRHVPRQRAGAAVPRRPLRPLPSGQTGLVHEIVAKTALGIDLGEQPRWG